MAGEESARITRAEDTPICACRNIKYDPRTFPGGLMVDRWVCACCGREFKMVRPEDVSDGPGEEDGTWARGFAERCGDYLPKTQTFIMPSLAEANTIINGERQDQYGAPEDSFKIIVGYWNVLLRQRIKDACQRYGLDVIDIPDLLTPLDSINMMVLFKQARKLGQQPKRDNYVDSIGYEAIGADRLMKEASNG